MCVCVIFYFCRKVNEISAVRGAAVVWLEVGGWRLEVRGRLRFVGAICAPPGRGRSSRTWRRSTACRCAPSAGSYPVGGTAGRRPCPRRPPPTPWSSPTPIRLSDSAIRKKNTKQIHFNLFITILVKMLKFRARTRLYNSDYKLFISVYICL